MSKRFGLMKSMDEALEPVPGTDIYCTLYAAMQVAEYVKTEQGLDDVAIYDYELRKFI